MKIIFCGKQQFHKDLFTGPDLDEEPVWMCIVQLCCHENIMMIMYCNMIQDCVQPELLKAGSWPWRWVYTVCILSAPFQVSFSAGHSWSLQGGSADLQEDPISGFDDPANPQHHPRRELPQCQRDQDTPGEFSFQSQSSLDKNWISPKTHVGGHLCLCWGSPCLHQYQTRHEVTKW